VGSLASAIDSVRMTCIPIALGERGGVQPAALLKILHHFCFNPSHRRAGRPESAPKSAVGLRFSKVPVRSVCTLERRGSGSMNSTGIFLCAVRRSP